MATTAKPEPVTGPVSSPMSAAVGTQANLRSLLQRAEGSLKEVLPRHMTADRLIKLALLSAIKTPKLLECTKESILSSLMTAAQLGLEPNGTLGSAYLVPYKKVCQLIPGYRGLVDLAKRSGEVDGVEARVVFNGEKFEPHYGTEPKIIHVPNFEGDRNYSNIRAFYVVATFDGGHKQFEIMSKKEVDEIRARSKAKDEGPWVTDYIEMGKKTVTKRGSKYWPLSPEKAAAFAAAVEHDNRIDSGEIGGIDIGRDTEESVSAGVAASTAGKMEELKQRMNGGAKQDAADSAPPAEETEDQRNLRLDEERIAREEREGGEHGATQG